MSIYILESLSVLSHKGRGESGKEIQKQFNGQKQLNGVLVNIFK